MKTTIDIADDLLLRVKKLARQYGITLRELVEEGLHNSLERREHRAPFRFQPVTAKGKGALAEHMRALARQNGIAIVQDIPLARLLYRKVKVGREIPAQTYKAVAAILAFVYRLAGKREGTRA